MRGELKVGLVGRRGASFIAGFNSVAETEVTAICEIDRETLDTIADRYGIERRYLEYEEMLEDDIDIVVIGTPMHLHVPQAVMAMEKGKHVMSEVTAAVSFEQCHMLVEAVRRTGMKYMMAENYCYMKPNVLVKSMVEAGLFGEIYFGEGEYIHDVKSLHHDKDGRPTWRYTWQVGINGCTYPTHSLGPVLQWFGEKVKRLSCIGTGVHTDPEHVNEDTTIMLCKTDSDALIKVRLDMLSNRPHNMTYYSIQGTKGCYEAPRGFGDDHKVWLADYCKDPNEWRSLWEFEEKFLPDMWKNPPEEALRAGHGGGDYFVVRDFVDSIINDTDPPIDVYRALDFTVPALVSEESINRGGAWLPVLDFREL